LALTPREFLCAASSLGVLSSIAPAQPEGRADDLWSLWYRQPAKRWLDALPIGNGRLGAMVFGGVEHEVLALNEATVWSGSPNESEVNPSTREYLNEMRRLLFEGHYAEGNALCAKHLSGREGSYGTHLPLANLHIDDTASTTTASYHRSLNLDTGVARVGYSLSDRQFLREAFVSNPDNVLVVRLSCNHPGQISCILGVDSGDLPGEVLARDGNTLLLMSSAWEKKHSDGHIGVNCQTWVRVISQGGTARQSGNTLVIHNADEAILLIAE
jgi:alpha-L-fucosidase 2